VEEQTRSLSEVAGLMGVSERTVRRWIKSGRLKAYKPGRDYRIPETALRTFIEESEISPKVPAPPSSDDLTLNHLLEEEERRRTEYDLILLAADSSRALKEILDSLQTSRPDEGIKAARRALTRAFISMQAGFRKHGLYERLRPYATALLVIEVTDDREERELWGSDMSLDEAGALVRQTPADVLRAIYEIHATRRELTNGLREELGEWHAEEQLINESMAKVDQIPDWVREPEMLMQKLAARESGGRDE
jgi:excisionase family DNA binding protein